jgi:hypothetical protein
MGLIVDRIQTIDETLTWSKYTVKACVLVEKADF